MDYAFARYAAFLYYRGMENHYAQLTSNNTGAMSLFLTDAAEEVLSRTLDARLGAAGRASTRALSHGEIRHGWLRARPDDPEPVDEVLLVKTSEGRRLLMTHGGVAIQDAVDAFFEAAGFAKREGPAADDPVFALPALLSRCLTGTQAAVLLAALDEGGGREISPATVAELLRPRRLLLAGPPNVGKSTILNALVGYDRAFTHHEPGATRDVVDAMVDLAGYAVRVEDLPGYSVALPELDQLAWQKAAVRLAGADMLCLVLDASLPWDETAAAALSAIRAECGAATPLAGVLLNKSDLAPAIAGEPWREFFPEAEAIAVCALEPDTAKAALESMLYRAWDGVAL